MQKRARSQFSCVSVLSVHVLNVKKTLDSGKVDDALHKFERYEAKIDDLESQVEAYDLGKKTLADEFRALESENKKWMPN